MINQYLAGNTVSLPGAFAVCGATYDPETIACKVLQPDATVVDVSSSVVKLAAGSYAAEFVPTEVGNHTYEWTVSGGGFSSVSQGHFFVTALPF